MIDLSQYNKEERTALAMTNYTKIMQTAENEAKVTECVKNTVRYKGKPSPFTTNIKSRGTNVFILDTDSVSCLFNYVPDKTDGRIAVLNFASFKNPGGMFLNGSPAQEESLCHQSLLYPILAEFKSEFYEGHLKELNRGLYSVDLLYTKDVPFYDYTVTKVDDANGNVGYNYTVNQTRCADVITIAAPNAKTFYRRQGPPNKYNEDNGFYNSWYVDRAMQNRIDALLYAAMEEGVSDIILGAFGCGVFGNDPYSVADIFEKLIHGKYDGQFSNVYFPIPSGLNKTNFNKFLDVFCEDPRLITPREWKEF